MIVDLLRNDLSKFVKMIRSTLVSYAGWKSISLFNTGIGDSRSYQLRASFYENLFGDFSGWIDYRCSESPGRWKSSPKSKELLAALIVAVSVTLALMVRFDQIY